MNWSAGQKANSRACAAGLDAARRRRPAFSKEDHKDTQAQSKKAPCPVRDAARHDFVVNRGEPTQLQAVEPGNALEGGERHLDLRAVAA